MYLRKAWDVLLVDDEPDVLSVSKLALKNVRIYGIPLKIHTATSKAEAIAWLQENPEYSNLALAMIDVIMESDTAGLDLCGFLRNELGNRMSPIYLRTGQPGKAPERRIIDDLDITGYVAKVEATEDRLYTIVKSSVRHFFWARTVEGLLIVTNKLIETAGSRGRLLEALHKGLFLPVLDKHDKPLENMEIQSCMFLGKEMLGTGRYGTCEQAEAFHDEMLKVEPVRTSFGGTMRVAGGKTMLEIGGDTPVQYLAEHTFDALPNFYLRTWFGFLTSIQHLYTTAK